MSLSLTFLEYEALSSLSVLRCPQKYSLNSDFTTVKKESQDDYMSQEDQSSHEEHVSLDFQDTQYPQNFLTKDDDETLSNITEESQDEHGSQDDDRSQDDKSNDSQKSADETEGNTSEDSEYRPKRTTRSSRPSRKSTQSKSKIFRDTQKERNRLAAQKYRMKKHYNISHIKDEIKRLLGHCPTKERFQPNFNYDYSDKRVRNRLSAAAYRERKRQYEEHLISIYTSITN